MLRCVHGLLIKPTHSPGVIQMKTNIQAVIFDVDGTLVDSVHQHAQAWQDAFDRFGKCLDFETVRNQIGKGGDQILPTFLSKSEIQSFGDELKEYRGKHFKEVYLHKIKPFAKVRDLFEHIIDTGKRTAVGSSAHSDELDHYLELCGVADLVDVKTCADDADRSKPHPDIFEAALSKLGETPSRTMVVGDSPYDAEAALKINLKAIGFLSGGFDREWLEKSGFCAIFANPSDLLQRYSESPLAD